MAHNFYCRDCGTFVASCGMPEGHDKTFSFSTTCGCGSVVSGSCGGRARARRTKDFALFSVTCRHCKTIVAHVVGKRSSVKVAASCPKCGKKRMTVKALGGRLDSWLPTKSRRDIDPNIEWPKPGIAGDTYQIPYP